MDFVVQLCWFAWFPSESVESYTMEANRTIEFGFEFERGKSEATRDSAPSTMMGFVG